MNLKSTTNVATNKYELALEVSAQELDEAIGAVFKKESKKLNIPGFRRGKAPRAFIEKYYGPQVFFEAAVDYLYRPMITEAIEKSELAVIAVGDFDIADISKEKGIDCKITVIVKPEIQIEGYKGIEVTKTSSDVGEEEVQAEIDRVLERNSRLINVEDRAAKKGDSVIIDYEGAVDGELFDGGAAEKQELSLGAGQFIPGFEEQVEGHNIGDEFDVNVTFPEDSHASDLMGKAAVFKVKLHEIKTKELPEFDEEFVKDVSEFDTVEAYKADMLEKLSKQKKAAADSAFESQLVEAVIEKVQGEIPEEMVEGEVDEILNSLAYRLQSQGLDLKTYMQYTGMTAENMREQYKAQAEGQVKIRLALEKIGQLENIEASEQELEDEYKKLAETYEMPDENVRNLVSKESLSGDIVNRKVIEFLKESAVEKAPEKKKPARKTTKKAPESKNGNDTEKEEAKAESAPKAKKAPAKKPAAKKPAVKKAETEKKD